MTTGRPVVWIGSSRKDLRRFPREVRRDIGQALYTAQQGETDLSAKPLRGFGGGGVLEIIANHLGDTWRAVYTVRYEEAIYVLHVPEEVEEGDRHAAAACHPDPPAPGRSGATAPGKAKLTCLQNGKRRARLGQ